MSAALSEGTPFYAKVLNEWGTFMHLQGDLKGAIKALEKSAALAPELTNTRVKLAGLAFDSEVTADRGTRPSNGCLTLFCCRTKRLL